MDRPGVPHSELDCAQPPSSIDSPAGAPSLFWPAARRDARPQLSPQNRNVHVWAASLAVPDSVLRQFAATLSASERERAERFRFELHRTRFIARRGLLRALLAGYLDTEPGGIQLPSGPWGKPKLGSQFAGAPLEFNLAHSEDLALLAFTRGGVVGIDLERIRPLKDADELVARFFSEREHTAFQGLSPELRPVAFFNLWTRKEAWLKATGEGIAHSLPLVEVSFLPGDPPALLSLPDGPGHTPHWTLSELRPAQGFAAALAFGNAARHPPTLQCWKWNPGILPRACAPFPAE